MPTEATEMVGVTPVESTLTRSPSLRSTRSRTSLLSSTLRRNHLLLLYAFAGFLLLRMWFFAFSRHDSKLISFCAFIILLAAYIWWSRRGRQARQSRQAALVEQMVAEGRLPMIITQRRLHEEMGITEEGKEALKYFEYSAADHDRVMRGAEEEQRRRQQQQEQQDDNNSVASKEYEQAVEMEEGRLKETLEGRPTTWDGGVPAALHESSSAEAGRAGTAAASGAGPVGKAVDPYVHIDQACAVCLTDYEDGDRLCILPCLHCYHAGCIEIWLDNHSRCPLCNHDCNDLSSPAMERAEEHEDEYEDEEEMEAEAPASSHQQHRQPPRRSPLSISQ